MSELSKIYLLHAKIETLTDENALLKKEIKKEIECWKKWGVYAGQDFEKCGLFGLGRSDLKILCFDTTAERDECYDWLMKQREGRWK